MTDENCDLCRGSLLREKSAEALSWWGVEELGGKGKQP